MSERITYCEKYNPGSRTVKKELLPKRLPFRIETMELRAAGTVQRDGEELEFQDVRVYLREVSRG